MCLIVFSFQPNSETPLIVAANRDEFYRRRAEPLGWWPGDHVLAGKDLGYTTILSPLLAKLGLRRNPDLGTWLGVNRQGRFAALTNFRNPSEGAGSTAATSRGLLVSNFLKGTASVTEYGRQLELTKNNYNGYNLLFGDSRGLFWFSNRSEKPALALKPGVYGLSNALLDTPWAKVKKIKAAFGNLLPHPAAADIYRIMNDSTPADDHEVQQTGLSFAIEKGLSSPFIRLPGYGTRVTSFLEFSRNGEIRFGERTYRRGNAQSDREFVFNVQP